MVPETLTDPNNKISKKTPYQKDMILSSQLDEKFERYKGIYQDLADYLSPSRMQMTPSDKDKGRRNEQIINCWGVLARQTLSAGLMAGVTNPARPWKYRKAPVPALEDRAPVAKWLKDLNDVYFNVYDRTNFYLEMPTHYDDLETFATSFTLVEKTYDPRTVARYKTLIPGSYRLMWDKDGNCCGVMFRDQMDVYTLMQEYCPMDPDGNYDISGLSLASQNSIRNGQLLDQVTVVVMIRPNENYNPKKAHAKFKRYASRHWEEGQTDPSKDGKYLRESGFDYFPGLASTWKRPHGDSYGSDSPGWNAIGDLERLQILEEDDYNAIQLGIEPPIDVPSSFQGGKIKRQPGATNVRKESSKNGEDKVRPLWEARLDLAPLEAKIEKVQAIIDQAFYKNLILTMNRLREGMTAAGQITATEVQALKDEGLIEFGPVMQSLERMLKHNDNILFEFMWELGMIPMPIPEELQDLELKDEYASPFAIAMKIAGSAGLDRWLADIAAIGKIDGSIRFKVNTDNVADIKARTFNVDPSAKFTNEEAAARREAAVKAQLEEQRAATIRNLAAAGKDISQAGGQGAGLPEVAAGMSGAMAPGAA